MYQQSATPQSIGGILDDAIRLFRESFSRTWVLTLGFSLVMIAISVVVLILAPQPSIQQILTNPTLASRVNLSPLVIGRGLISFVLGMVFYGALFSSLLAVTRGETLSTGEAIQTGLRRAPGLLLATILFTLAMAVGFVLLVIPGLFVLGRLQLYAAALFADGSSAVESLSSSWNLTRGRWWRTFTTICVAGVIGYVLISVLGAIPMIATIFLAQGSMLGIQLAAMPTVLFSYIVFAPVMAAVLIAVHRDCKLRSGGGDLAERAASLNNP